MVKENYFGKMAIILLVIFISKLNMDEVNYNFIMEILMKVILKWVNFMVKVHINGPVDLIIKDFLKMVKLI